MTARIRFWFAISLSILIMLSSLFGCADRAASGTQLQIRILNNTPYAIDNLWLGAGARGGATENTEFGAIGQGETSAYSTVEALLDNYRKLNFVANGARYNAVVDIAAQTGSEELIAGSYTFVCSLNGDDAEVSIVVESQ